MREEQRGTVAAEVVHRELDTVTGGDAHVGSVPGIGEIDDVLAANRSFYEAFEARDLGAMSDVWEHSGRVVCTHPGWSRLEGWGSVSASFYALFDGSAPIQFILTAEKAEIVDDTAWVSVDENILGDDAGATAAAVNLFVRNASGWRMVLHHSSQIVAS